MYYCVNVGIKQQRVGFQEEPGFCSFPDQGLLSRLRNSEKAEISGYWGRETNLGLNRGEQKSYWVGLKGQTLAPGHWKLYLGTSKLLLNIVGEGGHDLGSLNALGST
jgi:hypothetical protein